MNFKIETDKRPAGDQPQAIQKLVEGVQNGVQHQTLLGVTGSGKTFTVANVILKTQKPTLVLAHNKTLAAQLTQEYREFFPNNSVQYFVSYYDYYQPEAYVPITDTYIEKEAQINKEIDRLRHSTTQALLTRRDVIVVASVSAIYGLGNPEEYLKVIIKIEPKDKLTREEFIQKAISVFFERTHGDLAPGLFRVTGETVEIVPTNEEIIYRIEFDGDNVAHIQTINLFTREMVGPVESFVLFPAKHFVSSKEERERALVQIEKSLKEQTDVLKKRGLALEAERLRRRTLQDISLIREVGYCTGIENYSRYFDGREPGEPPHTLLSYFPKDFLTIIDESHVTIPQIAGMHAGDRSRKDTLVEHGFRLPSAIDNRPLNFEEFEKQTGVRIYTSATPSEYEKSKSVGAIVEQLNRPTGLVDPKLVVHPVSGSKDYPGQVKDFIQEAKVEASKGNRILVTTLTKKTAEDLSEYLTQEDMKARYLHSDIKTIERVEILTDFRKGVFDVLVGVNLLREGLDLPEVTLVAILDADREGFLRTETSIIQTIGRAARNSEGRVLLYADSVKGSLQKAIQETERRRKKQIAYNEKHNITPKTIKKALQDITLEMQERRRGAVDTLLVVDRERYKENPKKVISEKKKKIEEAVKLLDFRTAAVLQDEILKLEKL